MSLVSEGSWSQAAVTLFLTPSRKFVVCAPGSIIDTWILYGCNSTLQHTTVTYMKTSFEASSYETVITAGVSPEKNYVKKPKVVVYNRQINDCLKNFNI